MSHPVIAILGPTASGKSAVAMDLARMLGRGGSGAEIVSCDSMQVYRELEIGTAKPSLDDLREIPHHLVNCVSIDERFDTNRFVAEARIRCRDIQTRGKIPLLVGGTGLYAKAFLYGYRLQPACDTIFRQVRAQAQTDEGLADLLEELRAATGGSEVARQTLANSRRLIRAVEILRLTGKLPKNPPAMQTSAPPAAGHARQFVLLPPKDELRTRIEQRTRAMLERGWIAETRRLIRQNLLATPTAYQALGYKIIADWDDDDNRNVDRLTRILAIKTWQYARRQMTWFRHQHRGAACLTLKHNVDPHQTAKAIVPSILSSSC